MKTFNLIITSKNKSIIKNFVYLFIEYSIYNSNSLKKYFKNTKNKEKIVILKSPHVNKSSQEHFENIVFKKHLLIKIQKTFKYIIFLKQLSHKLFSNINVQLKQILTNKNLLNFSIFNINCFKIKLYVNKKILYKNYILGKGLNKFNKKYFLKETLVKKANLLFISLDLCGEVLK